MLTAKRGRIAARLLVQCVRQVRWHWRHLDVATEVEVTTTITMPLSKWRGWAEVRP